MLLVRRGIVNSRLAMLQEHQQTQLHGALSMLNYWQLALPELATQYKQPQSPKPELKQCYQTLPINYTVSTDRQMAKYASIELFSCNDG